jgi:hypothetical protein
MSGSRKRKENPEAWRAEQAKFRAEQRPVHEIDGWAAKLKELKSHTLTASIKVLRAIVMEKNSGFVLPNLVTKKGNAIADDIVDQKALDFKRHYSNEHRIQAQDSAARDHQEMLCAMIKYLQEKEQPVDPVFRAFFREERARKLAALYDDDDDE